MRNWYSKIKTYYNWGGRFLNNPYHYSTKHKTEEEIQKTWQEDIKKFKSIRKKYLMYEDFE